MANEPNINKIKPSEALIFAREWLKKKEPTAKEDSATKNNKNMKITHNPNIRPNITKLYSPCDVLKKAIEESPIAGKFPKKRQKALLEALSSDPDILKKIG